MCDSVLYIRIYVILCVWLPLELYRAVWFCEVATFIVAVVLILFDFVVCKNRLDMAKAAALDSPVLVSVQCAIAA